MLCITFIVFKMQIYEQIFFKLSKIEGGVGDPPRKIRGGGGGPPSPRDRRLYTASILAAILAAIWGAVLPVMRH